MHKKNTTLFIIALALQVILPLQSANAAKSVTPAARLTVKTPETAERNCIVSKSDILEKLQCIAGLTARETTDATTPVGVRQIELTIMQPLDHEDAKSEMFSQRLVLLHRSEAEPMVLQTSGYSIFGVREAAITKMFRTNQLQVEHRFFASSKPTTMDWSKLDIKQSADDFHQITMALKQIYAGPWVNTGASKGGMTSIYHRRFYPDDLVGTVSDVAPLSYTRADQRYNDFINNVGGEAYKTCRENIKKIQYDVLKNREEFLPSITGTFSQLGNKNVALEHATIESIFYFWQYGNPDDPDRGCLSVPVNGTTQAKFEFIRSLAALEDYDDGAIANFMPYYYQAATQLGSPDNYTAHLEPLRLFEFRIDQYTPKGVPLPYSNAAMLDVEKWLHTQADEIVFIYGQFDPWTAGEMPVSETGRFVRKYYVPKGNHGAKFVNLSAEDKSQVIDTLKRWLQKEPAIVSPQDYMRLRRQKQETLEDLEFKARKRYRL